MYISESDGHLTSDFELSFAEHRFYRGHSDGSKPMGFVVHSSVVDFVRDVRWRGRAGAVHFFQRPSNNRPGLNIVVLGIHGGHGHELEHSLADLTWLRKRFPRNSQVLCVGDWNVDQLPILSNDPFKDIVGRSDHHSERRCMLQSWADSLSIEMHLPSSTLSLRGSEYDEFCLHCPITRVPIGLQEGLPACLDYAFASHDLLRWSCIEWAEIAGDHCLTAYECTPVFRLPHRYKKHWQPFSAEYVMSCMQHVPLSEDVDVESVLSRLAWVQSHCQDNRSCRQRRRERMPTDLRVLYTRIANLQSFEEARTLRREAWARRRQWMGEVRLQTLAKRANEGRVFEKSKKLHTIKQLWAGSTRIADTDSWADECKRFYDTKWRVKNLETQHRIDDFVRRAENCQIDLTASQVAAGFKRLRKKSKIGCDGVSCKALEFLFICKPDDFVLWLSRLAGSSAHMSRLYLEASVFGKDSSTTTMDDTRVIMPLPAVMGILDAILPYALEPFITSLFPVPRGVWIGAQARTQPLDIAHGMASVIEKALDLESVGAVGQSDVRQFYDSINLLRIFIFLTDRGLDHPLAAACIRLQLLVSVRIKIGPGVAHIGRRCIGSLTGSRLAGMAAKVPILHLCNSRSVYWERFGFRTPSGVITMSTFVDNLFAAGRTCNAVSVILDDAEKFLMQHWDLKIKPSSRAILAPLHCVDVSTVDDEVWPVVSQMKVLGHWLESDGGIRVCFDEAVKNAWTSFYANCAGLGHSKLSVNTRLTMLSRAVTPVLRFRWTRWPFTASRALQLDAMQRRMYGIVLRLERYAYEDIDAFVRRRGRRCAELQKQRGAWSIEWANGIIGWSAHLSRQRNAATWAAMVSSLRTPAELAERRAAHGRPGTRVTGGYMCRRWFESVSDALLWAQNST